MLARLEQLLLGDGVLSRVCDLLFSGDFSGTEVVFRVEDGAVVHGIDFTLGGVLVYFRLGVSSLSLSVVNKSSFNWSRLGISSRIGTDLLSGVRVGDSVSDVGSGDVEFGS